MVALEALDMAFSGQENARKIDDARQRSWGVRLGVWLEWLGWAPVSQSRIPSQPEAPIRWIWGLPTTWF